PLGPLRDRREGAGLPRARGPRLRPRLRAQPGERVVPRDAGRDAGRDRGALLCGRADRAALLSGFRSFASSASFAVFLSEEEVNRKERGGREGGGAGQRSIALMFAGA